METKHTPGPWSLSDEDSPLLSGADGAYIAQVFARTDADTGTLRDHYAADARLIAAAPDLLRVLQLIHANAAESPEWIRARIDPIIARATGSK